MKPKFIDIQQCLTTLGRLKRLNPLKDKEEKRVEEDLANWLQSLSEDDRIVAQQFFDSAILIKHHIDNDGHIDRVFMMDYVGAALYLGLDKDVVVRGLVNLTEGRIAREFVLDFFYPCQELAPYRRP